MHRILLLLLLPGIAWAKANVKLEDDKARELLMLKINATLEQDTVLGYLRKCAMEIKKGDKDGRALPTSKYSSYTTVLNMYSQNRWFVADTGLSMKWFSDVRKLMKYMYTTRDIIETAMHNHQTKTAKYQQAVKYFDVAYESFVKLIQKPVKVSAKVQRKEKQKKVAWQKAMKKNKK